MVPPEARPRGASIYNVTYIMVIEAVPEECKGHFFMEDEICNSK